LSVVGRQLRQDHLHRKPRGAAFPGESSPRMRIIRSTIGNPDQRHQIGGPERLSRDKRKIFVSSSSDTPGRSHEQPASHAMYWVRAARLPQFQGCFWFGISDCIADHISVLCNNPDSEIPRYRRKRRLSACLRRLNCSSAIGTYKFARACR